MGTAGKPQAERLTAVVLNSLDANYGSLEAFTRAFRKAFQVSPSIYRRMGASQIGLPAFNGIHFCAPSAGCPRDYEMSAAGGDPS